MSNLIYSKIQHIPRKKLDLSVLEYILADMIYQLSTNPKYNYWCVISKDTMAEELGLTKQGVLKIIDRLIKKGVIKKDEKTKYLKHTELWFKEAVSYSDTVNKDLSGKQSLLVVNKVDLDGKQSLLNTVNKVDLSGKQSLPNNNIYNNINNNINNNISNIICAGGKIKSKKDIIDGIYKIYTKNIDIDSKYWYPAATKNYLEALLVTYTEEEILTSINNYFAVTERKRRKSPKYFFSNSKRSDNYRCFEGFLVNNIIEKPIIKKINIEDFIP